MILKKKNISFILQLVFFSSIIALFYSEKIELSKFTYIFTFQNIDLICLVFLNNLIISILFFAIIKRISSDKIDFFFVSSTYLQGGLISQVFPGTGIFYRYYKFRNNSKISFLEYSFSQTFLSIFSLSCIFFLTITFWFLKIFGIKFSTLIFFFILVFTAIYSIYICKNKIFKFFKKKILHIKKVKKYFNELKKIKNIIFFNKSYFQFIFILFFFLTILRCFIFYTATKKFAFDVGLLDAFFIYLNSIFLSTLLSMNFIGFYEVILTIIASFITDNFFDIMFIGLSLRLLNIFSIFFWILLFSTIKKIR